MALLPVVSSCLRMVLQVLSIHAALGCSHFKTQLCIVSVSIVGSQHSGGSCDHPLRACHLLGAGGWCLPCKLHRGVLPCSDCVVIGACSPGDGRFMCELSSRGPAAASHAEAPLRSTDADSVPLEDAGTAPWSAARCVVDVSKNPHDEFEIHRRRFYDAAVRTYHRRAGCIVRCGSSAHSDWLRVEVLAVEMNCVHLCRA